MSNAIPRNTLWKNIVWKRITVLLSSSDDFDDSRRKKFDRIFEPAAFTAYEERKTAMHSEG